MKPIFEKERKFLEEQGINIPRYCWKDGMKIYLNANDEFPIITLEINELLNKINIKKNIIQEINNKEVYIKTIYKGKKYDEVRMNKTFKEELDKNTCEKLDKLIGWQVGMTIAYLNDHQDSETRISISGGKDSSVMNYVFRKFVLPKLKNKEYKYDGFNTTNDTADTYRQMYKEGLSKQDINNPLIYISDDVYKSLLEFGFKENQFQFIGKKRYIHIGWYQWVEFVKGWWIPNVLKRSCCSTFKEGQVKLLLNKNKKYTILTGVRKFESTKRADYEFNIKEAIYRTKGESYYNLPSDWVRIAPICYLTDTDVWLYILKENIEVNPMYELGFERVGCLICPYGSPYTNLLIQHFYSKQWDRWMNIVKMNYKIKNVEQRLKWTVDEYSQGGKWRVGLSKEYEIISRKKTKERIQDLAETKGISYEMAEKYWDKRCNCGKKLNPDEIAMNFKLFGRYEGKEDNRQLVCKDCICKQLGITSKEYTLKVQEFRSQGCNLF